MNVKLFCCCFLLFSQWLFANELEFRLRSLKNVSFRSFNIEKLSKPTIFMVFQSNCTVCLQQITEFKCVEKKYDIFLIGAFGLETELRKEYAKMKKPYPAYMADNAFLEKLNLERPMTPQLLVINGTNRKNTLGLSTCDELKKL